jgi:hypothetical protein
VSRRKDRERFLQLKQHNPDYTGFRGTDTAPAKAPEATVGVVCSVCRRKRNVSASTVPADRGSFVCLTCQGQERQAAAPQG